MLSLIKGPRTQVEIDRNLFFLCWLPILPSVSLLFGFNGYVFACLLIGGFARLFLTAVRLPNGERGHFQILFYAFPILAGICIRFEFAGGWILLVFFWAFLVYSESRLLRHHRDEQANSRKAGPTAS